MDFRPRYQDVKIGHRLSNRRRTTYNSGDGGNKKQNYTPCTYHRIPRIYSILAKININIGLFFIFQAIEKPNTFKIL